MNGDYLPRSRPQNQQRPSADSLGDSDIGGSTMYDTLKEAIMNGDRGTITWLLNEGCPVNDAEADRHYDTPLHIAVFAKDADVARTLLAAGAQVNAVNFHKQTALHLAFEMGNLEMVDLLLAECDGLVNPFTVYGLSHFHIACVRNDWRVAWAYLERGLVNANVHLEKFFYGRDYVYYRPLHLAVKHASFEVAELLLKYGANVNAGDRYRRTPLHLACRCNCSRLGEALRGAGLAHSSSSRQQRRRELMGEVRARLADQTDIVELLARHRADLDALDALDTPPIFHLFKCDYPGMLAELRRRCGYAGVNYVGGDDDVDGDDGEEEEIEEFWQEVGDLLRAMQREKFYILVQRDVDFGFCGGPSRESLLHLVIDGRKLFDEGGGGNGLKLVGPMEEHRARRYHHHHRRQHQQRDLGDSDKAEIVELLLRHGADAEAKNAAGQTALQLAVASRYLEVVRALLRHGASVAGVSFFHYKVPRRRGAGDEGSRAGAAGGAGDFDLGDMEAFLEVVGEILARKTQLGLCRSNELLMLRYVSVEPRIQHLENCSARELARMLDYGDVNEVDASLCASERSVLENREKIALVLEHMRKLEIAGLPVDAGLRREFARCGGAAGEASSAPGAPVGGGHRSYTFADRCREEIEALKGLAIDRYASFYDLLFLNANEVAVRLVNEDFRRAVRDNCHGDGSFVLYNAMIVKQYVKGLTRSILLNLAKEYLGRVFELELPDPCSESIIGHLRNEDLCNLALAFE